MAGKRFHVTPFTGFRPVSQVGRDLGAQIVVNGDGWKERVPMSIAASDGLFYQRRQKDFRPWVNISQNNQVSFAWRNPANLFNAVSGDRFLIQNGRYNEAITDVSQQPRTALGFIPPGKLILLVADGRTTASAGLTFKNIATIFIEHGVTTAINLDGGGSSAMWIKNRIVNVPIHDPGNPGVERAVANHLCIFI
jgi:exopolysaccharide biosynthesis protein